MMAKRPTMRDVAKLAGVGVATVDRVLNGRHPVRAATSERVLASAEQLGYHAAALIRDRIASTLPVRRFGFLLQKQSDVFYQNLAIELQAETLNAREIHGSAKVVHVDELAPGTIASAMKELGSKVDAVACVAVDHPWVTNAVEELHEKGVPVIALLTPLSAASISGYIGLDNRKLGRTAAWLMARLVVTTGKVGLFVGSHRYIGHELTEGGFRSYFRENAGKLTILETAINLDDPDVAYGVTLDLLKQHTDLVGIYDVGGGREGIIRAIRDEGFGGRIAVICNELTVATRAALIDDTITCVLSLPVREFCRATVAAMIRATRGETVGISNTHILPLDFAIAENLMS